MQKYNRERFDFAMELLRKKCINSPRSVRARVLNTIINKIGKKLDAKERRSPLKIKPDLKEKNDSTHNKRKAEKPNNNEWERLEKTIKTNVEISSKKIDIICPVYRGLNETLRCIYSVLIAKTNIAFDLIVINDKSPDNELTGALRKLSKKGLFTYIENKENKGFVKTTNLGMLINENRDVIWLNSDTEVYDYWIDNLVEVASLDNRIATVTPLSNNATIASYPNTLKDNNLELEISDSEINAICAKLFKGKYVLTPTGVGFCMLIKRSTLKKVGLLDEQFNLGYGEENDLCQRFIKAGYINVITPSVFVTHYGSISFKESSAGLCHTNLQILKKLHPNYEKDVANWCKNDPLRTYRIQIDAHRLLKNYIKEAKIEPKDVILHLSHNLGGGTETFISDLIDASKKENIASFRLFPGISKNCYVATKMSNMPNISNINYRYGTSEFEALLKGLSITKIHVHSIVNWELCITDVIVDVCKTLNVEYVVSIHDYHWGCSRINLISSSGSLCLEPEKSDCFGCDLGCNITSYELRKCAEKLFSHAKRIFTPNIDTTKRINRLYRDIDIATVPHSKVISIKNNIKKSDEFCICFIGHLTNHKGLKIIENLCDYIRLNNVKAKIVVIGKSDKKIKGAVMLGEYKNYEELSNKICESNPSVFFLSSIWPETFSYTLSEMLTTDIPIASFNIGAQAERLKEQGMSANLIDINLANENEKLINELHRISKSTRISKVLPTNINPSVYYK